MQNSKRPSISQENDLPSQNSHLYEFAIINDQKSYKCLAYKCEKVFRFKSDITRHIIIHTKAQPHACEYPRCFRKFKRPDALKHHMQSHKEEFQFVCPMPGCDLTV